MKYVIYSLLVYTLLVILLIPVLICYLFVRVFVPHKQQIKSAYAINRVAMNIWAPLAGLKLTIINQPKINKGETVIVIMNHVNIIDMFLAAKCLKIASKPLIKKEILSVPILGWMFRMTAIPVNRSNKLSRENAYLKMQEEVNKGCSLLIFPEGSRNNGDNILSDFKSGAFNLSVATNTKIYPVVIVNSKNIAKPKSLLIKPGKAELFYLDAVDPSRFSGSSENMKDYCFKIMQKAILDLDLDYRTN